VQAEPACWRPYTGWYGDRRILKPDLSLTLGLGKWRLHWFVEIDRATEHRPALARKLAAYETAWRGGGEQYRRGVFPGVCWVVPDKARAAVVEEMCAKSGAPDQMFNRHHPERSGPCPHPPPRSRSVTGLFREFEPADCVQSAVQPVSARPARPYPCVLRV
jgi:hypothetical protein